ncbi:MULTISPECIES: heparinase II/III family protein [Marinomonas]|uniref:Heparinase II/III family protein n=1 Tax=Marinomonas rhodophyticola TaxID=2992803 RepID=A0ABT3KKG3_9GAMM|nr:heparinase II/III family protein [Marinomonas sp. KJ51-3]MCW4631010.1 heparinase II/III family protein [Marinomonas sp. KJ51-3]
MKFNQVYYRLFYYLKKVKITSIVSSGCSSWRWSGETLYNQSIFKNDIVLFLNEGGVVNSKNAWNSPQYSKLWLYNLHYFDDLNSESYAERELIHYQFIDRWIAENPACFGNGWEPYPISLRLVNWVKWFSRKESVEQKYLNSIAIQADALTQQLEYHILGNHLFANAKALVFVGAYLQGKDAKRFLDLGLKILDREIPEQFLDDGAHFELSPMYHEILLWDLLELIDLAEVSQNPSLVERHSQWRVVAEKALRWLKTMMHPDGEISFFNDAAIGIAAKPHQIFAYADKLKLSYEVNKKVLMTNETSGYSRVDTGFFTLFFDHANVGPDYLPGHAHADTLSFEMSVGVQRVFVNSGTSLYGVSAERLRQRETSAHNTVVVNGKSSSEVWSGFRVARRAYATLLKSDETDGVVTLSASHDGYKRLNPKIVHKRTITSNAEHFTLLDELSHPTDASFHLHIHPDVLIVNAEKQKLTLQLPCLTLIQFECECPLILEESTWHPEFGVSVSNKKIVVPFNAGRLSAKITILKDKS